MRKRYGCCDKSVLLFILALAAVHLIFFLLALHYKRIYNGDSFEYIYAAVNLKDHLFFYSGNPALPLTPEYMTFRTPGYPLLLAAVYLFQVNNWIVLILQNILSVCNLMLIRRTLIQLGYKSRYDWLLLLLLLFYPAQFIHANTIEPEILLQSFVLLYIHGFVQFFRKRETKYAWLMSVALCLGLFIKPVLYPYTAIHVLLMAVIAFRSGYRHAYPERSLTAGADPHHFRNSYRRVSAIHWIGIALIPVISILCYNSWNASRTGKFHFTSNQSFNAIYYFYFYKSSTEGIDSARRFLHDERERIAAMPEFSDRYDYAHKRGRELFRENFPGYLFYHLKHSLRFFVDPGKGDIDLFTGKLTYGALYQSVGRDLSAMLRDEGWIDGGIRFFRENPSAGTAAVIFLFNLVKLAGLVLFLRMREIPAGIRVFMLLFFAYFALLTGPISTPRYVLPVAPVYAGVAALGLGFFSARRKTKEVIPSVH